LVKKPVISALLLLLSQLALIPANAEDRQLASGVLSIIEAAQDADVALRDVVFSMLAVQFERRGVRLTNVQPDSASSSSVTASGLQRAVEQNTQYFLLVRYSTTENDLDLNVELYDVASRKSLGAAEASGRIGLSLDSVVAQALNQALDGVAFRPPAAPAKAVATQPAAAPPASSPLAALARKAFRLTGGAAPFLPLGGPGGYAQLGVLATLSADYRFSLGPGELGVGVLTGMCITNLVGLASNGSLLVVPIGAELTYSMNEGGFPGVVVRLSGGPAIMSLTTVYDGTLTKPAPYLLAGVDLAFPMTPLLGLSVELAWTAFFESASLAIMGFVPEMGLYVRL
jgi:hypothetical protein